MPNMRHIGHADVGELLDQLSNKPQVWNRYNMRTQMFPNSPHREVDDIWLRYRDWSEFDPDNPTSFSDPHTSINYPAWYELPAAGEVISNLVNPGDELGGCLITRIKPGGKVYPHSDAGAWHSTYYETKVLVLLQSAPDQSFNFEGEAHVGVGGDVFEFDNHPVHWVLNDSDVDRVSLICAIRRHR